MSDELDQKIRLLGRFRDFFAGLTVGIVLTALLMASAANAASLKESLCVIRADNARLVMQHRQNGRPKSLMDQIVAMSQGIDYRELNALEGFIESAYNTPVGSTTYDRRAITEDFIQDAYDDCMRGR